MDSRLHSILLFLAVVDFLAFAHGGGVGVGGVGVIEVTYKFPGSDRSLSALRAHDVVRHLAILAGVDIPLGGTGRPDSIGVLNGGRGGRLGGRLPSTAPSTHEAVVLGGASYKATFRRGEAAFRRGEVVPRREAVPRRL